jgi:hypothetical protein
VRLATERRDGPTDDYLLGHPLVAEYWAEGAEKLGVSLVNWADESARPEQA